MDRGLNELIKEYLNVQAKGESISNEKSLIKLLKESDNLADVVAEVSSPDFAYELGGYTFGRLHHMDWVNNEPCSSVADREGIYIGSAYILGYKEAVEILSMSASGDALIYPIMFSAMQYIELALKRCLAYNIEFAAQEEYEERLKYGEDSKNLSELLEKAIYGSQQPNDSGHYIIDLWDKLKKDAKSIAHYGWDDKDIELIESIISRVFKLNEHMGWRYWKALPKKGGQPYLPTKDMVIDSGVINMFINILDDYFADIYDFPMIYTEEDLQS